MSTAAFHTVLGCIGLSPAAQDAVVHQGFTAIMDLIVLGKYDVKGNCKIICTEPNPVLISFMQQQMFEAKHYWVKTHSHLGLPTAAAHFIMAIAQEYVVKRMVVDSEEMVASDQEASELPEKFKKQAKWLVFAEAIATYLSQQKGGG